MSEKRCSNCFAFDKTLGVCRLCPPTPIIMYKQFEDESESKLVSKRVVSSKYPSIPFPDKDWCEQFRKR